MRADTGCGEAGFTLIEALVALAILAIAAGGLIRAAEADVDRARDLELRAAARWVAQNRLAELRMGDADGRAGAMLPGTIRMLDHDFRVTAETRNSDDRDLRQLVVTVAPADGSGARVILHGFADAGSVTP